MTAPRCVRREVPIRLDPGPHAINVKLGLCRELARGTLAVRGCQQPTAASGAHVAEIINIFIVIAHTCLACHPIPVYGCYANF